MTDKNSKIINFLNKFHEFCYYSLFILTPLIMTSITSELFEFNKMIFIYLITVIIVSLWVTKMILLNKIIIKKTPFDIPIFIFFLFQMMATIFSIDRHTSIFGYYGRFNGGLLSIASYLVLYYALIANYKDFGEVIMNRLLKISLISSLLVIFWGLPGRIGYDLSCWIFTGQLNNNCWTNQFRPAERLFSTLGQPNWLGAYLAINFFIGLYFLIKVANEQGNKVTRNVILSGGYLLLNFSTILFTRSRSALLAVILGLGVLFSYLYLNHSALFKKQRLFLLLLLIPILLFKTGITKVDKIITLDTYINLLTKPKNVRTTKTSDKNQTTPAFSSDVTESGDIRRIVWKGAIDLGKKFPVFGTGVETFAYSYYFVRPKDHNLTSEWDFLYNKAHNEYLNYLATTGFIGLGSYLLMIGIMVKYFISNIKYQISNIQIKNKKGKNDQQLAISNEQFLMVCLFLAYLSILITNFFGFSTTTINLFFYLIPALLIITSASNNNVTMKQYNNENFSLNQKIYFIVILLLTIYLLLSTVLYWVADVNYAKGDNYYKLGNYQEAANYLNRALRLRYEHVYQDKLSFVLANLAFISAYQKQDEPAKQLVKLSEYYNQKSLNASPKNVLYWKTKAKNDYLFYQISQNSIDLQSGVTSLKQAKLLAPTDPKISYSLAIFYSLLADESKDTKQKKVDQDLSLKEINYAIDQKSNDRSFYLLKGQLLKKFGNREEARKTFQYILDKFDPNDAEAATELKNL